MRYDNLDKFVNAVLGEIKKTDIIERRKLFANLLNMINMMYENDTIVLTNKNHNKLHDLMVGDYISSFQRVEQ